MQAFLQTPKGRILLGLALSAVLVALLAVMNVSFALVPAMLVPIWVSIYAGSGIQPESRRPLLLLFGAGLLLFGALLAFYLVNS